MRADRSCYVATNISDLSFDARGACALASRFALENNLDIDFIPKSHCIVSLKVIHWPPNFVNLLVKKITEKLKDGEITYDSRIDELIIKTKPNIRIVA